MSQRLHDEAQARVATVIEGLRHGLPGRRSQRIIREEMDREEDLVVALTRAGDRIRVEAHNNRGGRG